MFRYWLWYRYYNKKRTDLRMIRRRNFFFGWYLVGLMVVSMMLVYGIRNSFPVFFGPILGEFGWHRGSTAIMLTLNILVYGLTAPVAGSLVDRWKPRRVAFTGIFILVLATALCAFATELWHFYLLFGILAPIGSAFCGAPVLNPSLMHWFDKKRQLAIGLGQIGGSLSFAYGMFVEVVISGWGWRPSFFVMAGMLIVVLLPLYILFYHFPLLREELQHLLQLQVFYTHRRLVLLHFALHHYRVIQ